MDVWAVGVLAYELLVGRPPFERESREETYQYIQHREPALPAWMSEPARDFVTAALAKVGGAPQRGRSTAAACQAAKQVPAAKRWAALVPCWLG